MLKKILIEQTLCLAEEITYMTYGHKPGDILWLYYDGVVFTNIYEGEGPVGNIHMINHAFWSAIGDPDKTGSDTVLSHWRGRYDPDAKVVTILPAYSAVILKDDVPGQLKRALQREFPDADRFLYFIGGDEPIYV